MFRALTSSLSNIKKVPIVAILVLNLIGGCGAHLNEGQVRVGTGNLADSGKSVQAATDVVFLSSDASSDSFINPGDDFQITLVSAHICDFREIGSLGNAFASTNIGTENCAGGLTQGRASRGEIVILGGFHFRGSESGQADEPVERVIFFSDDVRETGQLLNFINLPLYGPTAAKFAAGRMKLSILELDQAEAEQQAAFLGQLAQVGATFSSPAQGPVIGALASIGEAFLKSNKDDRELAFSMGFDPTNARSSFYDKSIVHRLPLKEGYLAVVRRESRSSVDHFNPGDEAINICPERGLLVTGSDCSNDQYYADSTWLLLRISREDPEVVNAQLTKTAKDLIAALSSDDQITQQATAVQNLASAIKSLRANTGAASGSTGDG